MISFKSLPIKFWMVVLCLPKQEKKQIQIKSKLIANTGVENMMDQLQGDDAQYQSQLLDFLQRNLKEEEPTKK